MSTIIQPGRYEVTRVVRRVFGTLRRNAVTYVLLAGLLGFAPRVLAGTLRPQLIDSDRMLLTAATFAASVSVLTAGVLLQAALVHGAAEDLRGGRSSWGRSLRAGLARLLPAIGLALVTVIVLVLAGLLLLIPGLVLALMWMAAVPALVVEGRGVWASLARSAKLTEGRRWAVLGTVLLFLAFGCVAFVVGSAVVGVFGVANEAATLAFLKHLIGPMFAALFSVISSVMVATIYHELKTAREGEGAEVLAAAFD